MLFNIFVNDLFLLMNRSEICNCADDTTIYVCVSKTECVIDSLEQDATQLATLYLENYMKLTVDKCHLMIFVEKSKKMKIHIGEAVLEESDYTTRYTTRYLC